MMAVKMICFHTLLALLLLVLSFACITEQAVASPIVKGNWHGRRVQQQQQQQRMLQKGDKDDKDKPPENNVVPSTLAPTTLSPMVSPVTSSTPPTTVSPVEDDFVEAGKKKNNVTAAIVTLDLVPFRLEVTSEAADVSEEDVWIDALSAYLQSRLFSGISSISVVAISMQVISDTSIYTGVVDLQVPRSDLDWDVDVQQKYWLVTQNSELERALQTATKDISLTVETISLEQIKTVALTPFVLELSQSWAETAEITTVLTDYLQSNMFRYREFDETNNAAALPAAVLLSVKLQANPVNEASNKLVYTGRVELVLPDGSPDDMNLSVAEEQEYWLVTRQGDLNAALQASLKDTSGGDPTAVSIVSIELITNDDKTEQQPNTMDPEVDDTKDTTTTEDPEDDTDVTAATRENRNDAKDGWVHGPGAVVVVIVAVMVALMVSMFTMLARRRYVQRRKPSGRRGRRDRT